MEDISELLGVPRSADNPALHIGVAPQKELERIAEEEAKAEQCEAFPFISGGPKKYKVVVGGQEFAGKWSDYEIDRLEIVRELSGVPGATHGGAESHGTHDALLEQFAERNVPFQIAKKKLAGAIERYEDKVGGGCGCGAGEGEYDDRGFAQSYVIPMVSSNEVREWGNSAKEIGELNAILAEFAEELGVEGAIKNVPREGITGGAERHDLRARANAEEWFFGESAMFYDSLAEALS